MAFGGLKGTLRANATSIPNPATATGSVVVAVGDLVYAVFGEQTSPTTTTCSDNLGNTYAALSAATDAGTSTAHAYYSRVTVAGTLTTVSAVATASSSNYAAVAAVIEGPFAIGPLDANPANITSDNTSPFTCPTTGTLNRANEVVMCFQVATGSTATSASSPNTLAGTQESTATVLHVCVGYQLVSSTSAVAPAFTAGSNPTDSVLGTTSFKGAFIVGAGAGSYAVTGTAATLRHTYTVPAAEGSYALTGTAASLLHKYRVDAGSGSYAVTGTAATVDHGLGVRVIVSWAELEGVESNEKAIDALSGSYAVTGSSAALLHKYVVSSGTGAYAVTGTAASALHNYRVAALPGAYDVTGTAASLLHKWNLSAGAGSYAVTGTAATLHRNVPIVAGAGGYSLTGTAASLLHKWNSTAGSGSYVVTGTAASLLHKWSLPAGIGAYSLTGSDVSLTKASNKILAAGAGSYTLSGSVASALHGWMLASAAGNYQVTGNATNLVHSYKLSALSGSYALSGSAVSLLHNGSLSTGAESYSIVGTDAALSTTTNSVLAANAGSYSISGTAASLLHKQTVFAGSGSYSVSGSSVALVHRYVVAAGAGSYSITGSDASLVKVSSKAIVAGSGSYLIRGTAASLINSGEIPLPAPYVNETVTHTPRHERIGRPRPQLPPEPAPIFATASSGQGGQSVSAKSEFHIKGASQGSVGSAEFYFDADVSIKQMQSSKSQGRQKIMASVRSSQISSGSVGAGSGHLFAVIKSGGEALMVPTYAGEETPDVFFESVDRAA